MGGLIPIGEGADAEIKAKLNEAFSGKNLEKLQKHWKKEKLFDPDHRLSRFASRKKLHPTKIYPNDARRKWYYLLAVILPKATDGSLDQDGNPINTAQAIKTALTFALNDANGINRVVFEAEEQSDAAQHFVYPSNRVPGLQIGSTLNVILVCPAPLREQDVADPPGDNDPDPGEQPFSSKGKKRVVKKAKKAKSKKKK